MNSIPTIALLLFAGAISAAGSQAQQPADSSAQPNLQSGANSAADKDSATSATTKAKKVWTDDDLRKLGGVSVVGDGKTGAKSRHASGNGSKDYVASNYKQQLVKLEAQLDDTNKKLAELEHFNGDSGPDTAIQTNHGLKRISVADQIAQLETKKAQIAAQMQSIFDQARHAGIEPGALR